MHPVGVTGELQGQVLGASLLRQDDRPLRYKFTHLPRGKQCHPALNGIHG